MITLWSSVTLVLTSYMNFKREKNLFGIIDIAESDSMVYINDIHTSLSLIPGSLSSGVFETNEAKSDSL